MGVRISCGSLNGVFCSHRTGRLAQWGAQVARRIYGMFSTCFRKRSSVEKRRKRVVIVTISMEPEEQEELLAAAKSTLNDTEVSLVRQDLAGRVPRTGKRPWKSAEVAAADAVVVVKPLEVNVSLAEHLRPYASYAKRSKGKLLFCSPVLCTCPIQSRCDLCAMRDYYGFGTTDDVKGVAGRVKELLGSE